MRRTLLAVLVAAASLFALAGAALADDTVPPTFAPPAPAPVTDNATAANFAKAFAARNAAQFLGENPRRVRVSAADAACLQSPVVATRWGCVFTLRALVIQRDRGWDNWRSASARHRRGDHPIPTPHPTPTPRHRRVRVRQFGCLGFLRINGGPSVTPTAQVVNVECARIPRDLTVTPLA